MNTLLTLNYIEFSWYLFPHLSKTLTCILKNGFKILFQNIYIGSPKVKRAKKRISLTHMTTSKIRH